MSQLVPMNVLFSFFSLCQINKINANFFEYKFWKYLCKEMANMIFGRCLLLKWHIWCLAMSTTEMARMMFDNVYYWNGTYDVWKYGTYDVSRCLLMKRHVRCLTNGCLLLKWHIWCLTMSTTEMAHMMFDYVYYWNGTYDVWLCLLLKWHIWCLTMSTTEMAHMMFGNVYYWNGTYDVWQCLLLKWHIWCLTMSLSLVT